MSNRVFAEPRPDRGGKYPVQFRLSIEAVNLMRHWAIKKGVSQVAILEMALREFDESNQARKPRPVAN